MGKVTDPAMFIFGLLTFIRYVQSQAMLSDALLLPREIKSCSLETQPWALRNVTMRMDPDTTQTSLSAVAILKETLPESFSIHLDIRRCMNNEESSCRNFLTLVDKSFCKDARDPNKMWYPLVKHIKDWQPLCPVPAGSYRVVDVPFTQVISERVVFIQPGHWRLTIRLMDGARTHGCVLVYGEVKQKRRSRKKSSEVL